MPHILRAACGTALLLLAALAAPSTAVRADPAAAPAPAQSASVAVAPAAAATPAAVDGPTTAVDGLHAALLDVMKNAQVLGYAGREEKLRTVIPKYFDVDEMARQALGGPQWKAASDDAKRRYLETFERFMVANYAGRFDGYSGQSFQTLGETPGPLDTVIVKTQLIDPTDKNVELNYRMHQVDGGWKAVDVYMNGTVSELAVRRSEFVSIVKRQDLDALLVALDAKIAKLKAGGES
jgi:phospholipid transport system substrate-binding protein